MIVTMKCQETDSNWKPTCELLGYPKLLDALYRQTILGKHPSIQPDDLPAMIIVDESAQWQCKTGKTMTPADVIVTLLVYGVYGVLRSQVKEYQ